jgi:hypothetical protein
VGVPFLAGQRVLASDLNTATQQGAWTVYTPTFSGTLNNGLIIGSYAKVGRMVTARAQVLWGSTTTLATSFGVTLPFAAITPAGGLAGYPWTGSAFCLSAASNNRAGVALIPGAGTQMFATSDNIASYWTITSPQAWAVNDRFSLEVTYETAS